jgi:hypothetical protein
MQNQKHDMLAPDIAARRATDSPADAIPLEGYLAEGESPEYRHLYEDRYLKVFLRIPVDAIVDRCAETDDPTQGISVVWVKSDAVLLLGQLVRATGEEPGGGGGFPYPFG